MKAFVGVTDYDWFGFLRSRPELEEVNFWQPSGRNRFRVLQPGEPFLFKLHAPRHFIVGGGFFAHFSLLPHRMAWEFFEEKNGAATLTEMEQRIVKYRRAETETRANFTIGCILLSSPFFFRDEEWIAMPEDWSSNIVQGKSYDLSRGIGANLWREVELRLRARAIPAAAEVGESAVYGDPVLVRPRLGQGTFRALITDTYERHCAVTGERALPVLDAAHIRPLGSGGRHLVENGLLLRSDIHRLFDAGYVTVAPDHRFRVSRRLRDDFDNGEPYLPLDRQQIWLPPRAEERPSREFLEWHADSVFLG